MGEGGGEESLHPLHYHYPHILVVVVSVSPVFPIIGHLYRRYCQVSRLLRHIETASEKLMVVIRIV